jgi:hypothetical protein
VTVFASVNDSAYVQIGTVGTNDTLLYQARVAGIYKFYSVGVDEVGNEEAPPAVPDATTQVPGVVSVLISVASQTRRTGVIKITWSLALRGVASVEVDRRVGDSDEYVQLDSLLVLHDAVSLEDKSVRDDVKYDYRLRWQEGGRDVYGGETEISALVPLQLKLSGVRPNPSSGNLMAYFDLPDAGPAFLEVVEVAGRRVSRHAVGGLGPGSHALDISNDGRLPSGIYLVSLVRGNKRLVTRATVIR